MVIMVTVYVWKGFSEREYSQYGEAFAGVYFKLSARKRKGLPLASGRRDYQKLVKVVRDHLGAADLEGSVGVDRLVRLLRYQDAAFEAVIGYVWRRERFYSAQFLK